MLMRPVIVTCTAFVIRCERWPLTDLSPEYAGDSAHSWCRSMPMDADGAGTAGAVPMPVHMRVRLLSTRDLHISIADYTHPQLG